MRTPRRIKKQMKKEDSELCPVAPALERSLFITKTDGVRLRDANNAKELENCDKNTD